MFGTPLGVRLHPTQLYEALAEALIFLLLLARLRKKQFDGQVMALYLAVYGVARFLIEFVRDDPDRGFILGSWMSTSQLIAIVAVALAGAFWIWKRRGPAASAGQAVRPARRSA
jgi:phosphatidylglycerol:prolipoprotein diacylglycerol transferase